MSSSYDYRRAVLGAFAWAHIWHRPDVVLIAEPETPPHWEPWMGELPIRVTVQHPYGRPDPRGPDCESTLVTFHRDARGRTVTERGRPPAQVTAIVPPGEPATMLARHALAARVRLERELARGYGEIHRTSPPPPDRFAADRPLLPQWAATEVLDGELVTDDELYPKVDLQAMCDAYVSAVIASTGRPQPPPRVPGQSRADRRAAISAYHDAIQGLPPLPRR